MARYYRRRYTRVVRPKKKWASNYRALDMQPSAGENNTFWDYSVMAENKTEQEGAPIPVVIKTGNFKVQFDMAINVGGTGTVTAKAYVIFLPQGWNINSYATATSVIAGHPEWIMMWRQLDFSNANAPGTVDTSVVKMSSRLKRNLNSGDRVCFVIVGSGDFTGVTYKAVLEGGCQFWTCAN